MLPPKVEVTTWIAALINRSKRELEGDEYEQAKLMLSLAEPVMSFSSQHSMTDQFIIGNVRYEVVYFMNVNEPVILEFTENDPT